MANATPGPSNQDLPGPIHPGGQDPTLTYILSKPIRPSTQKIVIDNVDFKAKSFTVSTDISVFILDASMKEIKLNIGHCK